MFIVNFFLLAFALLCVGRVHCIVSAGKSTQATEKNDIKKEDNAVAQSIDRDYIAGYEEGYGHGSYGLSAHASYGFPEAHDSYGVIEGGKHHIHHTDDHHHHHHHDHHDHHKHYDYAHHKALAIKSLLVPLAGVALLGAAAAFVSNPILLQLGVISGSTIGRRKRSPDSAAFNTAISEEDRIRLNEIKLLEKFMSQNPGQGIEAQEKKMLANYLSCSGVTTSNLCLERLACELHSAEATSMPMEANVLSIVVNEILDNRYVPAETKMRLSRAIHRGKQNFGCGIYECQQLEGGGQRPNP